MPPIRLLTSTIPKANYREVVQEPKRKCSIEIQENTPASMRLVAYDSQHHLNTTLELNMANMPNFLTKHVETSLEHILLCSQLNVSTPSAPYDQDKTLTLVISLKNFLLCLEELYVYSAKKLTAGLLFVIGSDHLPLLTPLEELISFAETFISNNEEKTMVFIPTDLASYDAFIDFKVDLLKHLDLLLWSQQRTNSLIRHYLKITTLVYS
ncbi:MAG TPA: hypothetical protein VNJ29_03540 [Candidatus Nitrosotenuis sp.]|nr:hypothetical protein [Candidatus Nitrosotenuis sp.]